MSALTHKLDMALTMVKAIDVKGIAFTDRTEACRLLSECKDAAALAVLENDKLRGIIAFEKIDCVYCGLSAADMSKCLSGFPGCGRADDMLCAPPDVLARYEGQVR